MSKVIGYKAIIRNMIWSEVEHYIEKKSGKFATVFEDKMIMETDNKVLGYPTFEVEARVDYNRYTLHGYVGEFGNVSISCVTYDRMVCTEKGPDGWWITESAKPVHKIIYGEELEKFDFAS